MTILALTVITAACDLKSSGMKAELLGSATGNNPAVVTLNHPSLERVMRDPLAPSPGDTLEQARRACDVNGGSLSLERVEDASVAVCRVGGVTVTTCALSGQLCAATAAVLGDGSVAGLTRELERGGAARDPDGRLVGDGMTFRVASHPRGVTLTRAR